MASSVSDLALDISPPVHRLGPTDPLDTSVFHRKIPLLAIRLDAAKTNVMRNDKFKRFVLNIPKIRSVAYDPADQEKRLILLRTANEDDLSQDLKDVISSDTYGLVKHEIDLDYSYWTADEILQAVLPQELCDESPTSFTITGHLAHFNLRDEYLPYKNIIGQVVLDKHKVLRTVVNKLDNIDTEFRFFKMEVLAGEPDFVVQANESGCRFTFDFSEVYWNSRLGMEHERLVGVFKPESVIADVFGGVGPFAIPAAKKGCAVLGNDLNPNSAKYMQKNANDNHVETRVRVTCLDGRAFIQEAAASAWFKPFPALVGKVKAHRQISREARKQRQHSPSTPPPPPNRPITPPPRRRRIDHFVMNLPGTALEFLDAFNGCFVSIKDEPDFKDVYDVMPLVHCYCFTRELDRGRAQEDIRSRAEAAIGCILEEDVSYYFVRSVAPSKDMYCFTFRLPRGRAL